LNTASIFAGLIIYLGHHDRYMTCVATRGIKKKKERESKNLWKPIISRADVNTETIAARLPIFAIAQALRRITFQARAYRREFTRDLRTAAEIWKRRLLCALSALNSATGNETRVRDASHSYCPSETERCRDRRRCRSWMNGEIVAADTIVTECVHCRYRSTEADFYYYPLLSSRCRDSRGRPWLVTL